MKSYWDSPPSKEFPASGRTNGSPAGPIRNASSAACQPDCTLWQATAASLNVPFFDLTEHLGAANVLDMAAKAGVDSMWADPKGDTKPVRIDLRGRSGKDVMSNFSTELGIGQYPITVLDHANGMATFAAGGKRAEAHFVTSVTRRGQQVYAAKPGQTDIGLNQEQINQLNWTLRKVEAAGLGNGWDVAGKTGTWQAGTSTTENAHVWMVGYTRALAAAVWLGTTDGKPLTTKTGSTEVYGASHAAPIWRQFMVAATAAMKLDKNQYRFGSPTFPDVGSSPAAGSTQAPRPPTAPTRQAPTAAPGTPTPLGTITPPNPTRPAPTPSCLPDACPAPRPSRPITPPPTQTQQR
jgi:membrane peptidoglycan carboxypeptidase